MGALVAICRLLDLDQTGLSVPDAHVIDAGGMSLIRELYRGVILATDGLICRVVVQAMIDLGRV